jgi:hypothetical protein
MRRLHADECRERAEARGSGPDAKTGLGRFRHGRNIPAEPEERDEMRALAFPRPAPMDRSGGFATLVSAVLGLPDPNARLGGRDPKQIVMKMAPPARDEFKKICGQKAPEASLGRKAEKLANRLGDRFFYLDSIVRSDIAEGAITPAEMLSVGHMALEAGKVFFAHEIFEFLANLYLNSNPGDKNAVPHEVGAAATGHLITISRAWVLAHALSYFTDKYAGDFEAFQPSSVLGHIWSAATIQNLAKSGRLQDLAPLQIIGAECGEACMESYCHDASTQIKVRALLTAIPLDEIAREFGISGVSMEQLVHKVAFLLHVTNVASERVLSKMPAFRHFSPPFANVVDSLMEDEQFASLAKAGLDIRVSLMPLVFGNMVDTDWWEPSVEFLKQNGLLKEEDECRGALTEKGKQFLARIVSEMMKVEIKPA